MADWMAGLGAGLQSLGGNAFQYLVQQQERERQDELRKQEQEKQAQQQQFQNQIAMLNLQAQGAEDATDVTARAKQFDMAGQAAGATDLPFGAGQAASAAMQALAARDRKLVDGAQEISLPGGESRRFVFNPANTPAGREAARADALLRRQREDADAAQSRADAKSDRENRASWAYLYGKGGPLEGQEEYNPDFPYTGVAQRFKEQMLYQNRINVAKTPRTSTSTNTSIRVGGSSGGGGGGGNRDTLTASERQRLKTAETNRTAASRAFQAMLKTRPDERDFADPLIPDRRGAFDRASQRWAAGDSTFAAQTLQDADNELAQVKAELGIEDAPAPAPAPAPDPQRPAGSGFNLLGAMAGATGPAPGVGPTASAGLAQQQALQAIAKIQQSGLPPEEKARRIAIIRQRLGGQ